MPEKFIFKLEFEKRCIAGWEQGWSRVGAGLEQGGSRFGAVVNLRNILNIFIVTEYPGEKPGRISSFTKSITSRENLNTLNINKPVGS